MSAYTVAAIANSTSSAALLISPFALMSSGFSPTEFSSTFSIFDEAALPGTSRNLDSSRKFGIYARF